MQPLPANLLRLSIVALIGYVIWRAGEAPRPRKNARHRRHRRRAVRRNWGKHPIRSVQATRDMIARIPSVDERDRWEKQHRYAVAGFTRTGKETEVGSAPSLDRAQALADREARRYRSVAVYDVRRGDLVYSPRMAANAGGPWIVVRGEPHLSVVAAGPFQVEEARQEAKRLTKETGIEHVIRPTSSEPPGQLPDLPVPKGAERAYREALGAAWYYVKYRPVPRTKREFERELDADEETDPLWKAAMLEQYSRVKAGATSPFPEPGEGRKRRKKVKLKVVRNRRRKA